VWKGAQLPPDWRELADSMKLIREYPPHMKTKIKDIRDVLRIVLHYVSPHLCAILSPLRLSPLALRPLRLCAILSSFPLPTSHFPLPHRRPPGDTSEELRAPGPNAHAQSQASL
jgi:hypothetical protein